MLVVPVGKVPRFRKQLIDAAVASISREKFPVAPLLRVVASTVYVPVSSVRSSSELLPVLPPSSSSSTINPAESDPLSK